jgi:hypothetical protein
MFFAFTMTKVVFGPALASVGSTCLPFEPDGKGFVSLWSSRKTIGQVINMIWIFFNAVLPCVHLVCAGLVEKPWSLRLIFLFQILYFRQKPLPEVAPNAA